MNAGVLWNIAPLVLDRSATRAPSIYARGTISHKNTRVRCLTLTKDIRDWVTTVPCLNSFSSSPSGLSLLFYGLSFWFCKSSYEEESSRSEGDQGESGEELKCTVADQKDLGEQVNPAVDVTPGESKEELGSTVEQGAEG